MRSGTLTKRLENEPLQDCYLLHYCVQREKCRLSSHVLSMITEFVYIRTGLYEFFTYSCLFVPVPTPCSRHWSGD